MNSPSASSAHAVCWAVLEAVEAFRGRDPREDDLTLLVVQIP